MSARSDSGDDLAFACHLDLAVLDVESGGCSDLDIGAQTDSKLSRIAAFAARRLVRAQCVDVDLIEGTVEDPFIGAGVVAGARSRSERKGILGNEVDASKFRWIHVEFTGSDIDDALEHLRCLGATGATVRGNGRPVGHHPIATKGDLGDVVDALDHALGKGRQYCARACICAYVGHSLHGQAGHAAIFGEAHLGVENHVAPLVHGDHVFAAGLHPSARACQMASNPADRYVLGIEAGL